MFVYTGESMFKFLKYIFERVSLFFRWLQEIGEDQRTRVMTRGGRKNTGEDDTRD